MPHKPLAALGARLRAYGSPRGVPTPTPGPDRVRRPPRAFTCPVCGGTTTDPWDVEDSWCPLCVDYTARIAGREPAPEPPSPEPEPG